MKLRVKPWNAWESYKLITDRQDPIWLPDIWQRYILPSVSDFLTAAHMNLDGDRHFGAIHDMTHFH